MTKSMMDVAPPGKLVLALEGGYNVDVTGKCVAECVKVLLGEDPPPAEPIGSFLDIVFLSFGLWVSDVDDYYGICAVEK